MIYWKNRCGNMSVIFLGFVFLLLTVALVIMEFGGAFEKYQQAETLLQRACNSAVESNVLDEYRADGILKLDVAQAEADFRTFVADDMPHGYTVMIDTVDMTTQSPSMTATGEVTFSTLFNSYGFDDVTFSFKVRATNYRLE